MSPRHLFLTGEVQVGKSTLLRRMTAAVPGLRPGGFRTVSVFDMPGGACSVYLVPAAGEPIFGSDNRVGIRLWEGRGIQAFPEIFDTAGVRALRDAERCPLIVMDEIGRMEEEADDFSARVRELLDGKTPILGVVQKKAQTALAEAIRAHPEVALVEVRQDNRDLLLPELRAQLRRTLDRRTDSGGTVVFREGPEGTEVLLIRTGSARIAFPKGHLEPGELPRDAALRETLEETGVRARLLEAQPLAVPSARAEDERVIWMFPAVWEAGEPRPQPGETSEAFWETIARAEKRLTFAPDSGALLWAYGIYRK